MRSVRAPIHADFLKGGLYNGVFPPAGALRPSTPWPSSECAVWPSSVTACVSTANSTLMVGQGLSRMAITSPDNAHFLWWRRELCLTFAYQNDPQPAVETRGRVAGGLTNIQGRMHTSDTQLKQMPGRWKQARSHLRVWSHWIWPSGNLRHIRHNFLGDYLTSSPCRNSLNIYITYSLLQRGNCWST